MLERDLQVMVKCPISGHVHQQYQLAISAK